MSPATRCLSPDDPEVQAALSVLSQAVIDALIRIEINERARQKEAAVPPQPAASHLPRTTSHPVRAAEGWW
jgi:hypothetical protein